MLVEWLEDRREQKYATQGYGMRVGKLWRNWHKRQQDKSRGTSAHRRSRLAPLVAGLMPAAKQYTRRMEARFTWRQGYVMDAVARQLGISSAQLLRMLVE